MKTKFKISLILITLITIVLFSGNVSKAVFQSTPATHSSPTQDTWENWMKNIRNTENGAMGLSEEIDQTTLEGNDNNIDVHMMKNTEYGAIAILSLSNYGNVEANNSKTAKPETTTGNATGLYIQYNATPSNGYAGGEMTSGILDGYVSTTYNPDYYNLYGNNTASTFIGDAEDEFNAYTNRQTVKAHLTNTKNIYVGYATYNPGFCSVGNSFFYTVRGRNSLLSYDAGMQGKIYYGDGTRIWQYVHPLSTFPDHYKEYNSVGYSVYGGLWYARGTAVVL